MSGEFNLIERYFAPLAGAQGLKLQDDASLVPSENGTDFIVTKDLLIEGIHFLPTDPIDTIAHKALAVNVSDCIAKGASPYLFWLGLALPRNTKEAWFSAFSSGLSEAQKLYSCHIAGGDTTSSDQGPIVISITLLGKVPTGDMLKRSGASVGEDLYVSGTLGQGALGLWCLQNNISAFDELISAYQMPKPDIQLLPLLQCYATATADVSDGLIADVSHIAKASNVGFRIHQDKLPLSDASNALLKQHPELRPFIWSGGDDYQVIFTAPKGKRSDILHAAQKLTGSISLIGEATSEKKVYLLDSKGENMQVLQRGYAHF